MHVWVLAAPYEKSTAERLSQTLTPGILLKCRFGASAAGSGLGSVFLRGSQEILCMEHHTDSKPLQEPLV